MRFTTLEVGTAEVECEVGNDGCEVAAVAVCSQCGAFVCGGRKCRTVESVDYLEGKPKAVRCFNCR